MAQPKSGSAAAGTAGSGARGPRFLVFAGLSLLLVVALIVVDVIVLGLNFTALALSPHYYMALGNSLSFGYQPNLDFSAGFADDIYSYDLHKANVTSLVNYACAGETTTTMIQGGCVGRFAHKGSYYGPQLQAAVDFLSQSKHRGRVSPITLEIGANDVLPDWDAATCSAGPNTDADLKTMDTNLTGVIFPSLIKALREPSGGQAGDLHLLNYYNPFVKACPNSPSFIHLVNDHLSADAAQFRIPVVDVYNLAFGGDAGMASHICDYTWYCSSYHDIHPTDKGYAAIAQAVETTLGLPGSNPLPMFGLPAGAVAPRDAAVWRRLTPEV